MANAHARVSDCPAVHKHNNRPVNQGTNMVFLTGQTQNPLSKLRVKKGIPAKSVNIGGYFFILVYGTPQNGIWDY